MPVIAIAFVVAGLASLGLPGMSGFVAEFLVFIGAFPVWQVATLLAAFGIVITAGYLLWMLQRVFLGPLPQRWAGAGRRQPAGDLDGGVMVAAIVGVGVYPSILTDVIGTGVGPMADRLAGSDPARLTAVTENELDLTLLAPELTLAVFASLVILVDLFLPADEKRAEAISLYLSLAGIAVVRGGLRWPRSGATPPPSAALLVVDDFAIFFKLAFLLAAGAGRPLGHRRSCSATPASRASSTACYCSPRWA